MFFVLNTTQLLMHSEALSINTKITLFTISRFFQGVASSMFTISFVLLLEITGPKHRVTAGNITAYSFSVGQMIIVGLAYYFKDWRKVQWCLALYILPFFIYYWLVPESPRWLLSVGKVDEARRVLVKITRVSIDLFFNNLRYNDFLLIPGQFFILNRRFEMLLKFWFVMLIQLWIYLFCRVNLEYLVCLIEINEAFVYNIRSTVT